jgi:hypothetical protein
MLDASKVAVLMGVYNSTTLTNLPKAAWKVWTIDHVDSYFCLFYQGGVNITILTNWAKI